MSTEKKLRLIMAAFVMLAAYGVWNIFQPDVFPMSFVRGEVREIAPGVLGGDPVEVALHQLERLGEREQQRAAVDRERRLAAIDERPAGESAAQRVAERS